MAHQKRVTYRGVCLQSVYGVGEPNRLFYASLINGYTYVYTKEIFYTNIEDESFSKITDDIPLLAIGDSPDELKFGGIAIDLIDDQWNVLIAHEGVLYNSIWSRNFRTRIDTRIVIRSNCWFPKLFKEPEYGTTMILYNNEKDSEKSFGLMTEDYSSVECARLDVYMNTDEYQLQGSGITLAKYKDLVSLNVE